MAPNCSTRYSRSSDLRVHELARVAASTSRCGNKVVSVEQDKNWSQRAHPNSLQARSFKVFHNNSGSSALAGADVASRRLFRPTYVPSAASQRLLRQIWKLPDRLTFMSAGAIARPWLRFVTLRFMDLHSPLSRPSRTRRAYCGASF